MMVKHHAQISKATQACCSVALNFILCDMVKYLEGYTLLITRKRTECSCSVGKVIYRYVVIILVIHRAQIGECIQHSLLGLYALILHHGGRYAYPIVVALCAKLYLGVLRELLRYTLLMSCDDIHLTLEDMQRTKGTHARLVAVGCGDVEYSLAHDVVEDLLLSLGIGRAILGVVCRHCGAMVLLASLRSMVRL